MEGKNADMPDLVPGKEKRSVALCQTLKTGTAGGLRAPDSAKLTGTDRNRSRGLKLAHLASVAASIVSA